MSARARQERDDMETKLVAMKVTIDKLCTATSPTKRLVKKRREELRVIWEKLQSKHTGYCRAASVGLESSDSIEFLKRVGETYNNVEQMISDTLDEEDSTEDEIVIRRLKKRIKSLQSEIDLELPYITDLANAIDNIGAYEQALNMLRGVEDKLRKYLGISQDVEEMLDLTAAETFNDETEGHKKTHHTKILELKSQLSKRRSQLEYQEQ